MQTQPIYPALLGLDLTFCTDDGLDCTEWMGGADLAAFHTEQLKRHKDLIDKVGAAAITGE